MILIFPPCSTTNRRPLPSFGCSRPRGELSPETRRARDGAGRGDGAAERLGPPLLPHPTANIMTDKAAHNTFVLVIACTLLRLGSLMIMAAPARRREKPSRICTEDQGRI